MYCDVGSHLIAADENEYRCAHCGRRLCSTMHMGNPNVLPGDHIACIDHVEEVAAMEAKLRASRMRKQQRHPSTIMEPEEYRQARNEFYNLVGSGTTGDVNQWIFFSLIVKELRLQHELLKTLVNHGEEKDLKIGSIVHYAYNPSLLGLKGLYTCSPSIVMEIFDKKSGNIAVREFHTMDYKSCLYSEEIKAGSWHWPEDHHDE